MSAKFSPGPWTAVLNPVGCDPFVRMVGGAVVCSMNWGTKADARLIAAAPEMYELIEKFVLNYDTGAGGKRAWAELKARIDGEGP